jgi:hypothetical protein
MGKKKREFTSNEENDSLVSFLLPNLHIPNKGIIKSTPFEVPYLPEYKFYDVGLKGYGGDEETTYLTLPQTITYIRRGNTFMVDPEG